MSAIRRENCCERYKTMLGLRERMVCLPAMVLVTLFCLLPLVSSQKDNTFEMKIPASEPLTLLWGIADTTAFVGKMFKYTLPNDAFQGNIVHYDISEVGKNTLPSWLTFNPLKTELKGIPGPLEKGQVYLEVKVTGDDNSHADDVFSIEILDDTNGPVGAVSSPGVNGPKAVQCKRLEPRTIVTVAVDLDLSQVSPVEKMNLLENMASHLNLATEMLKLIPVGNKPLFDSGALVVGPGNIKAPKTVGALVSWIVGCGQVDNSHMSTLQQMESAAANGDLTTAVGHDIIGWHVTNTRFQAKPRKRRQATATPTMTPPAPTKVIEPSSTQEVMSTSIVIAPSKSVEVKPTVVPETETRETTKSTTVVIQPSETTKISSSSKKPTEVLPSTSFAMTSSSTTTSTTVMPSTTSTTTSSTVETKPPMKTTTTKPTTPTTTQEEPCLFVNKKLEDQSFTSGSIVKIKIPKDTFKDCYVDSTNDLDLSITINDKSLPEGFWLDLNKRQSKPDIILMNPLNSDAGNYTFKLTATNVHRKSASLNFVVVVHGQEMMSVPPNHELSVTIDTDYDKFIGSLDKRIELSNKISRIFGDRNADSLTVTRLERGSVVYAWTNNSLVSNDCPADELKALVNKMFNADGTLTESAQDALQPYTVSAAAAQPLGACTDNPEFPKRMTGMKMTTLPKPTTTVKPEKKTTSTEQPTIKYTDAPKTTLKSSTEKTTAAVAAAGAGGSGSDIWITTVVPAIVVVIVLIIALIIACCLYRKRRKGKMKLEEKNKFANSKGVPVIFADEYEEKPNDSTRPLILQDEKPPMPPPGYQRASSETSGNSNSTQPIEDKDVEEIEMEDTSEISPLYTPPPPVTASNNSKPLHVQSSRGPPPYVPP